MPIYTKWHKEVELFTKIKFGIILEGNIQDIFFYPEGALENATVPLTQYLFQYFTERNYGCVDPISTAPPTGAENSWN